jgi:hypothetical protein
LRLKRRETEEDSVSCPMKYPTDVECRSDSLVVISYIDINQFTYVNLSLRCMSPEIARLDSVNEAADLPNKSINNRLIATSFFSSCA